MKKLYQTFTQLKWWRKFLILFLVFFPLRFVFGIFSEFWFPDEMQIYLIGLKFYSGGHWPYFGPDVVYTGSQVPGALQGLLVGIPFYLFRMPEAPYMLLNILSFASLFLLGHYIIRYHTRTVPEWFVWTWIYTAPWVLSMSTHVLNPSYVLPAAVLFFVGFLEVIPSTRKNFVRLNTSFFLMGFSLLWIFQLHMSWILLMPLILMAFIYEIRNDWKKTYMSVLYFLGGCFLSGIFLVPTLISYGLFASSGDTASNIVFNLNNAKEIITVLLRFLSLASFELARFMGSNTTERLDYASDTIWAIPFIILAGLVGFAQVAWMIISWFRKNEITGWKTLKYVLLFSFIMTYISFFFSVKGPSSHTFYLMFPLVMIYSFYCWQPLFRKKWIHRIAMIFLFSGIVFHFTLAMHNYKNKSMYLDRDKPLKAIQKKEYKILGERRDYDRNK